MSHAVSALAARQHGNVTREQLLTLGLGRRSIAYRLGSGFLHRVHAGVYSVGRPAATRLERACAAVLAGGPGALLSHEAALALWDWGKWPRTLEIVCVRERRIPGLRTHRSRTVTRADRRRHLGIPVTSPARTLLDCAPRLTDPTLTRAVNDALRSPFLRPSQLAETLRRHGARPAAPRLAAIAALTTTGLTRSQFEDRFLAFCATYHLPTPTINARVNNLEVDAYFPQARLIVELDGWDFHQDRRQFETDRERDARALASGDATVRITWQRLEHRPHTEAARLHRIITERTRH